MADLILKADVAEYLNLTLTPEQESVLDDQILPAISQYVRSYCNRTFDTDALSFTEKFNGGFPAFFVKEIPIASITSVDIDGSVIDPNQYVNKISFVQMKFIPRSGFDNVEIVYVSNQELPDDLKLSLIRWGSDLLGESGADTGITSSDEIKRFTAGSVTVEYRDDSSGSSVMSNGISVPIYVFDVINRYRIEPK